MRLNNIDLALDRRGLSEFERNANAHIEYLAELAVDRDELTFWLGMEDI